MLAMEKEQLLRQKAMQRGFKPPLKRLSFDSIPMQSVTQFLSGSDFCRLASTSSLLRSLCAPDSKLFLSHLTTPKLVMTVADARAFLQTLCLPSIHSVSVNAKLSSGKALMLALAEVAHELASLERVYINAAGETGDFIEGLFGFFAGLGGHQLLDIHLSGFRSIEHVATCIGFHTQSVESLKIDYFVSGHECDVTDEMLPVMPRLTSLFFDVADVTDLPVTVLLPFLQGITNPSRVTALYLPHMQISGQSGDIRRAVNVIKSFTSITQLVLRFRQLPLSIPEILSFRAHFSSLPAVCISDHFIVMLQKWASWWPAQQSIWETADEITGLSVFREQIDFESLGSSATREWLKLSVEEKEFWSRIVAKRVLDLYLASV